MSKPTDFFIDSKSKENDPFITNGGPTEGATNDLAAHGRAMGIFRTIALVTGFILWALTIFLVALFVAYEDNRVAFNTVGLWAVIAMTATLCMNFYMTVQSKKFSEHFQKSGRMMKESSMNQVHIIKSLCSNFNAAYYIDLVTGEISFLSLNDRIMHYMGKEYSEQHSYEWYVQTYCDKIVDPSYKDEFIKELSRDNLKNKLLNRDYYTYVYLGDRNGKPNFYEMKVTKCEGSNTRLVVGFADVDAEIREKNDSGSMVKEALKKAENANKAKNVFLSNVSKELLMPLNEISGHASMVVSEADTCADVKEEAAEILKSTEKMSVLINDILDISTIESGDIEFSEDTFGFKDVIHESVEALSDKAKEKKITLSYNADVTHDVVIGDRTRFYSVIRRLEDYAADLSAEGSSLSIKCKEIGTLAGRGHFEVTIEGDTLKLDEKSMSGVFDLFFSEGSTDAEAVSTAGTGFIISKCILELMKGRLEIKAGSNGGTRLIASINFKLAE
ncbi:MAG: HAMP domain-containing histidine kinase [Lachnospiraceae bacterium]|nr:HAMP domain-containing histidine kinase [Lachnospiraceae bacterium]